MIRRRNFLVMGSLAALGQVFRSSRSLAAPALRFAGVATALAQLEKQSGGRLGVTVLDTGTGESAGHRIDERFAMCSTFKMLLSAAVLERADAGGAPKEGLDRALAIPAKIVLGNSPLTQEHAGGRMNLRDLCAAAMTRSDNTAANLLLGTIGGPEGFTAFARSLGDTVTRLDREETALNQALPGDPRDTTSPAATVADWRKLLLGDRLSHASRDQLIAWLLANKTGDDRLRAGLAGQAPVWRVGDKTGSNGETTTNDVAIVWPTGRPPLLIAAYLTECPGPEFKRSAILANVGRLVAQASRAA